MTKCAPNQHSFCDTTSCLNYSLIKLGRNWMYPDKIANTNYMPKALFNEQLCSKLNQ